jgi:rare lipoprotein A
LFALTLLFSACSNRPRLTNDPKYAKISTRNPESGFYPGQTWRGIASWYGKEHHGNRTASGEIFDMNGPTTAHRFLPMGARVKVINIKNGKSCLLKVNDRGPFINGRILDVSYGAAKDLGMVNDGLVEVQITIISLPK